MQNSSSSFACVAAAFTGVNGRGDQPGPSARFTRGRLDGQKILIVEDDFILANALSSYLLQEGAEVVGPVPTLGRGFMALGAHDLTGAILDIKLGDKLVFPLADRLGDDGVDYVFFSVSTTDIPPRHAAARHIEKWQGFELLSDALLAERIRKLVGLDSPEVCDDTTVEAVLPRLRMMAGLLAADRERGDEIVEDALRRAISFAEAGLRLKDPATFLANLVELAWRDSKASRLN